jgi:hypothetical protein
MVTVKMTEVEYEAYLLYLESVEIMRNTGKGVSHTISINQYLAEPDNSKEFEAGLEDVKAGRITYVDPENLWESIK